LLSIHPSRTTYLKVYDVNVVASLFGCLTKLLKLDTLSPPANGLGGNTIYDVHVDSSGIVYAAAGDFLGGVAISDISL
jgi:hypothetical protein